LRFIESEESATSCSSAQDELGDHDGAVDESGLGDIHDAAVDDHAGVQDFERVLGDFFPAEQSAQRRQVEHIALGRADDQAAIGHPCQQRQLKGNRTVGESGMALLSTSEIR